MLGTSWEHVGAISAWTLIIQAGEAGSWLMGHGEPQKSLCVLVARSCTTRHVPPWPKMPLVFLNSAWFGHMPVIAFVGGGSGSRAGNV